MRYFIICLLLAGLFCTSCGYDSTGCFAVVSDKYPDCDVRQLPGEKWRYIVIKKDGEIRYVKSMNNTNTKISHDVKVR